MILHVKPWRSGAVKVLLLTGHAHHQPAPDNDLGDRGAHAAPSPLSQPSVTLLLPTFPPPPSPSPHPNPLQQEAAPRYKMSEAQSHIVSFLLSAAVSAPLKNMSGLARVLVVVLAAAATVADPEPGYPAPCYDKTAYITKVQPVVKQVPVYSTIHKQQIIPTTLYRTNYNTLYTTVYNTQVVPKYVTETVYKTQVQYVTQVQTQYQTQYQTHYVTTAQYVPKYVTETQYLTKYNTQLVYNTVYTTQYTPVYVTKNKVQYQTHYQTEYAPKYVTVTKDKIAYVTDCPKPAYGYGY